jgi:hypothetical protein
MGRVSLSRPSTKRIVAFALGAVGLGAGALAFRAEQRAIAADLGRARELHGAAFAGSAACRRCHPDHVASWRRTFHRTMTQDVSAARPDAVAGDFSGVTYRYDGVVARMHRDGAGRFMMTFSPEGGGPAVDAVVVRAVGSRRYQQYLADWGGALWRLPMAFHVEERRWFHMNGAFLTPDPEPASGGGARDAPDAGGGAGADSTEAARAGAPRFGGGAFDRHVTRWNDNCVFCHNVAPDPGRDPTTGAFRTTVAELGVACEACHAPGAEHARRNEDPIRRYTLHVTGAADPTIVNPSRLSPARAADLCGRCHGQRLADDVAPFLTHGDPFVPGDDLALYSSPLWRDTALGGDRRAFSARFWEDGTPRLTAYEYQGMLESRCAERGPLTCTTCHGMHDGDPRGQIRPAALDDRACTGCHAALATPSSVAAHTRHDPTGPGARCVSCHMPRIVYGVLDVHPSHRIEIPDPARALALGRPDACTLCHVESDRAWAVRARARLWPKTEAAPEANAAAAANASAAVTAEPLDDDHLAPRDALFAGDPVARAVAADAVGRAPWPAAPADREQTAKTRAGLLLEAMAGDRYPAVRHLAARALGRVLGEGSPEAAAWARRFDATAAAPERAAVLASLRRALPPSWGQPSRAPSSRDETGPDAARVARLRADARRVDIDIGE